MACLYTWCLGKMGNENGKIIFKRQETKVEEIPPEVEPEKELDTVSTSSEDSDICPFKVRILQ